MLNTTVKSVTVAVAVVMLGSVLAVAQQTAPQAAVQPVVAQYLTGTVTCSGRMSHQYLCQRNQTLQSCTLACVQRGSDFVLAVGDTAYTLEGDRHSFEHFAGGRATVQGVVANDRVQVQTIFDVKAKTAEARGAE